MPQTDPHLLFSDDWLVVVNKPSGELTHPGWARGEPSTMSRVRDFIGQRVQPLHRLDRATSGVVVLARNLEATRLLGRAWEEGQVHKRYWALVRGLPAESGEIDHPVPRAEKGTERVPALTHFTRIAKSERARCSLVEARPMTGRLHQLRRHFKHLSHPIVGDVRYGDGRINREFRENFGLHRLALHACSLELVHPLTGVRLRFRAPLDADLRDPLERLGLLETLPSDVQPATELC